MSKVHSKATIINIARGKSDGKTEAIKQNESKEIIDNFKSVLGLGDDADLSKIPAE